MTPNQIRFGLMPVLRAARELPRTVLPLKSVHYRFVARGGLAEVEMTQVYRQENAQALDCEYLFPLPADGAIYRCEAVINGRTIHARIEEREAARKLVEEKKAAGHRTALVESERDNLFTLSLGNLQPQDVMVIILAYLQPLRRQHRLVSLDLPLCPGVRYIPGRELLRSNRGTGIADDTDQVPDASRITPPRIDGEHPDAAFVALDGEIDATFLDGDVISPSHLLRLDRQGDTLQLALAKGGEVPDRDLSLRWQEREPEQPTLRGWTSESDGHHFALLELRAPATVAATDAVPQDVYFLVDSSGSMADKKWPKAIAALHGCVGVLSPWDRVWVTLFASTIRDFDADPAIPAALLADCRFRELATMEPGGGTEMRPALKHVLDKVKKFSPNRPAVLVLITDAEIGNEREIVSLMREYPALPVHCFGIDTTLNDSLLLDLVRQQGGAFHALTPQEDVAGRVTQLGRTLRQPVLVNLRLPEGWELAAGALPNLYAGQIHLASVRSRSALESNPMSVVARDHRNRPVTLDVQLAAVPEAAPRLRWCKERLVSLAAQDDKAAAIALSRESNLLCPFTAFVAVDDQEKVVVAAHRLVQPALSPDYATGVSRTPSLQCCLCEEDAHDDLALDRAFAAAGGQCGPGALPPPPAALRRRRAPSAGRSAAPNPAPAARPGPSYTAPFTRRIREFLKAIGDHPHSAELATSLQTLLDWLDHSADPNAVTALGQLLDECERQLGEWHRRQERLHKLSLGLADELEQTTKMLRQTSRPQAGQPSCYDDFRSALARANSGSARRELEATLGELEQIEHTMLALVKEFVLHR